MNVSRRIVTCLALALSVLLASAAPAADLGLRKTAPGSSLTDAAMRLYASSFPRAAVDSTAYPEAGTCSVTPIACNTNQGGSLGFGDCTLDSDGTYVDIWTFSGTAGQTVTITMRSSAFDSYLALGEPDGDIVEEDNNSGGGQDARITYTLTESGTWGIIANQWSPASGSYTLSLQCEDGDDDCTPQFKEFSCGILQSSSLDAIDCTIEGFLVEYWGFQGTSGQSFSLSISRTSGSGNLGVIVFHEDGETVLGDEMPDNGTASVSGTLPKSGMWVVAVVATSNAGYTMTTSCQAQSGCVATPDNLCLNGNRFRVTVTARDPRTGKTGGGRAVPYNSQNGFFSLPALTGDAANFEIFVKILDGRPVNGRFWVFYGGLTDFEYTIRIVDATTGQSRTYTKPGLQFVGGADTSAF